MGWGDLLKRLHDEITDADEETFLLFSQSLPSQDLGFVDHEAGLIELSAANRDFTITQSPGLLKSDREEGTTGAVVWRVTPRFAEWIVSNTNVLHETGCLDRTSTILELGCGSSGILPLVLAPKVGRYVATDQPYVFKLLRKNLDANRPALRTPRNGRKGARIVPRSNVPAVDNIQILALDWEANSKPLSSSCLLGCSDGVDLLVACDCIYNDALIGPFVKSCANLCRLRQTVRQNTRGPCVVIVAQQLRSDSVFASWLAAFSAAFHVWRLPDELMDDDLRPTAGYVVHAGILKDENDASEDRQL